MVQKRLVDKTSPTVAGVMARRLLDVFPMPDRTARTTTRTRGVIVLVEDDDALRETLRIELEMCTYRVFDFDSAEAALRDPPECPSLAILDYRLPRMNGLDLLGALRARYPALPAIIVSSDCSESLVPNGPGLPAARLLRKPFARSALLSEIEDLVPRPNGSM